MNVRRMKELISAVGNFAARWTEEKALVPRVEVALVLMETNYGVKYADGATIPNGEVVERQAISQTRFSASPASLRKLSAALVKLADESEALLPTTVTQNETESKTA